MLKEKKNQHTQISKRFVFKNSIGWKEGNTCNEGDLAFELKINSRATDFFFCLFFKNKIFLFFLYYVHSFCAFHSLLLDFSIQSLLLMN